MDSRLKKLLDKASVQITRSGLTKPVIEINKRKSKAEDDKVLPPSEYLNNELDGKSEDDHLRELSFFKDDNKKDEQEVIPQRRGRSINKSADDDDDEIKAYLNQLSRKTKPQSEIKENVEKSENELSIDSDLDSLMQEFKDRSGKSHKQSSMINEDSIAEMISTPVENKPHLQTSSKNKTSKTLEKVTHYENKYLKSKPQQSYLLESESDISDLSLHKTEIHSEPEKPIEDEHIEEIGDKNLKTDINLLSSDEKDDVSQHSLFLLDDLHVVDELIESVSLNDKEITLSSNSEKIETISSMPLTQSISYQEGLNFIPNKTSDVISTSKSVSNEIKNDAPDSESTISENSNHQLLKNVHFDTISEIDVNSTTKNDEIHSPIKSPTETQSPLNIRSETHSPSNSSSKILSPTKSYSESFSDCSTLKSKNSSSLPEKASPLVLHRSKTKYNLQSDLGAKNQRSFGVQVKVADPHSESLFLNLPRLFDVEIEPRAYNSTIAQLFLKQSTLEALSAVNPSMMALNEMIREQINFSRAFLMSHQRLHASQVASLRPDYHYTTWENTLQAMQTYRKKKQKKMERETRAENDPQDTKNGGKSKKNPKKRRERFS